MLKRLVNSLTSKKVEGPASPDPEMTMAAGQTAQEYLKLGWECRAKNDLKGAFFNFDRAISLAPMLANAYYGRGVVCCMLERYKQALADLDRAICLRPNFAGAITERGLVWSMLGNRAKALADYDLAITVDPAYDTAHQNRGVLYADQNKWSNALDNYDLAVKLNPTGAQHYLNRGMAFYQVDKNQNALEDFTMYLRLQPDGPHASIAQESLENLQAITGSVQTRWAAEKHMWKEFVILSLQNTIGELIERVQEHKAYYVVLELPDGRQGVESVYGESGLRSRLTEIADVLGRDILRLRLDQVPDLWLLCMPIETTATEEQATRICEQCGGRTVVIKAGKIVGVLETKHDHSYPDLPTVLFGKAHVFGRENRPFGSDGARQCHVCNSVFSYYLPVITHGLLSDYACPQCGASPIPKWVEDRMKPGNWSESGFLAEGEDLSSIILEDSQALEQLQITYDRIADALDSLLEKATMVYESYVAANIERMIESSGALVDQASDHERSLAAPDQEAVEAQGGSIMEDMVAAAAPASGPEAKSPLAYSIEEIDALMKAGELPPKEAGVLEGDYQVFLCVYMGYQYCPWTILKRPWSSDDKLGTPVRMEQRGTLYIAVTVPGLTLPCRSNSAYRYADRDFLIVNRKTGEYLKGPGLSVHLIRDHHFFEGKRSLYRIDPKHSARVLGLI